MGDASCSAVAVAGCSGATSATDMEDVWRACNAEACEAGRTHYIDPATGYRVFSEYGLRKRGKCCGCGCRHCPYNHGNVSMSQRAKRIQNAAFLNGGVEDLPEVDVLFWSGGKDSFLALRALKREAQASEAPRPVVLLTTFEVNTRQVAHQEVDISDVVRQAESMYVPLLGVPLHAGPSSSYKARVEAALRFVASGTRVRRICFGDLHLEHIRQWRFDNLTEIAKELGAELHFPVWKVPYDALMRDLQASRVPCVISAVMPSESLPAEQEVELAVGSLYGPDLVDKLPEGVDKFGEAGEFHTLAQVWLAEGGGLSGLT